MKKLNRLSAIIALILIAAFILPSTAVVAAANDSNLVYFYGDLNANGEIDKFDYIIIKRSCMNTLSLTDEQILRGDVNNDGKIDKFDYILVKRHIMGTYTIPKVTLCEHELESINAKDATCDKNGNIAYFYCAKCEKCYSDAEATNEITPESTVIAAKGHDNAVYKYDVFSHWKECACGEKSETTAHSFDAWATVVESTCTVQGTRMRVCITCGYIASEKLPLLEHTYGDWLNDTENHWKECVCGKTSEPASHTYGEWGTVTEPTCTKQGTKKRDCVDCGHTETDVIAMLPHSYDKTNYNSSAHWKECVCGKKSELALHTYTDVVTPPTENKHGFTTHTCNVCGHSYKDSYVKPTVSVGLAYTVNYDGVTCTVTGIGTCSDTDLFIPSEINGYKVTSIGRNAFLDCYQLTSVTIGNSVTSIGYRAFDGCASLASITIPDSVTTIGDSAFEACTDLTSITIPDSVTSIGSFAFYNCDNLTTVTIGNGVTSIGVWAFDGCYNLKNLTIGNGVSSIGDFAFKGCTSLTSINIPDCVTSIGQQAFRDCSNLTSVTIGNSVTSIGDGAFFNCDNLKNVTIGNSVTSIGDRAFSYCYNLTSITIPDSVTSIGDYAFDGCDGLKYVYYQGNVENWLSIQFENYTSNPCYYAENLYFNGSLVTELVIPDSVTSIGYGAFRNCTSLTSVTIGNSVISIGDYAFYNCTSLTSVTIGNSVTSIGEEAFYRCASLTSITLPDSVTSIGEEAFYSCDNLKDVYYQGNVENWFSIQFESHYSNPCCNGAYLYFNDVLVRELVVPDSVTSIGSFAFYRCASLTSITIPDSVTSIGDDAFFNCYNLKEVFYQGNVENWLSIQFEGYDSNPCCNVANLYFNDVLVTELVIPDSVTSIGYSAFEGCTALKSITIPDSVTSIGDDAFYWCYNLKDVYYTGSQEEWDQIRIGSGNSYLTSATIHYNSK